MRTINFKVSISFLFISLSLILFGCGGADNVIKLPNGLDEPIIENQGNPLPDGMGQIEMGMGLIENGSTKNFKNVTYTANNVSTRPLISIIGNASFDRSRLWFRFHSFTKGGVAVTKEFIKSGADLQFDAVTKRCSFNFNGDYFQYGSWQLKVDVGYDVAWASAPSGTSISSVKKFSNTVDFTVSSSAMAVSAFINEVITLSYVGDTGSFTSNGFDMTANQSPAILSYSISDSFKTSGSLELNVTACNGDSEISQDISFYVRMNKVLQTGSYNVFTRNAIDGTVTPTNEYTFTVTTNSITDTTFTTNDSPAISYSNCKKLTLLLTNFTGLNGSTNYSFSFTTTDSASSGSAYGIVTGPM